LSNYDRWTPTNDPFVTELLSQPPTPSQVGIFRERVRPLERNYLIWAFSGIRAKLGYDTLQNSRRLAALGKLQLRFF
jgi:hypothetical protein